MTSKGAPKTDTPPTSTASLCPSFKDLGKSAKDLFCKDYGYGYYNLKLKTTTVGGFEFNARGGMFHETHAINGDLGFKYIWPQYCLTFHPKWHLDNRTEVKVEMDDYFKGLKAGGEIFFVPLTGKAGGKVEINYKNDFVNTGASADLSGSCVSGSAVFQYNKFVFGTHLGFDTKKASLTHTSFVFGRNDCDSKLNLSINNGSDIDFSVYHKVNDNLEVGITKAWAMVCSEGQFGVATKYNFDKDLVLGAKVNNRSQIGLSFKQKLGSSVTLLVATLIEGKHLDKGGHKFGLGLEFDC